MAKLEIQATGGFSVKKGPIFANIVLADEINRAGQVRAALLEAPGKAGGTPISH